MKNPEATEKEINSCSDEKVAVSGAKEEEEHFIGGYEVAPQFMKDNHMITDGYRINFNTPRRILKSMFMIHNQSVNIWSHCLPAFFLIFMIISFWLVIDLHEFMSNMKEYQMEVEQSLHSYHVSLKNISAVQTVDGENEVGKQELVALKTTILMSYREVLNNLDKKSMRIRQLLDYDIQGIKSSIHVELKSRLTEFEKSKLEFEHHIAPAIVQAVQHTFNSSYINILKEHVEKMKNHLDSSIFQIMQLHEATPNPQAISRWPIFVFLGSAVICLLSSTIFHLFHPMSVKAYGLLLRFDFAGISLLISGSAFPTFYYALYCEMAVATIYLTFSFSAAIICFVVCLFEWIHKQGHEKFRSIVFGTFGLLHLIPLSHITINDVVYDNYGDPFSFTSSIIYYVMLTVSYCSGLYVFTVRCPERNNPGRYNICGHSHQIWHFFVVLGIVFTYFGVLQTFEMRKHSVCPA